MPITSFLLQTEPPSIGNLLMWPAILCGIGLIMWYFGLRYEYDDGSPLVKWLALVPVAIGFVMAAGPLSRTFGDTLESSLYRELIGPGRRLLIMHWFAAALPVLTAVAIYIWYWWDRKTNR